MGESTALSILVWQVLGCQSGICVFSTSDLLVFDQLVSAIPDRYDFDWNGDGTTDQTSLTPIPTHLFLIPGTYRPSSPSTAAPATTPPSTGTSS